MADNATGFRSLYDFTTVKDGIERGNRNDGKDECAVIRYGIRESGIAWDDCGFHIRCGLKGINYSFPV